MDVTVIVGTFGEERWARLARTRAIPSAKPQAEVIHVHDADPGDYGARLARCRNAGAERASSEWLCFLDSDDELLPGFFDAMDRASADLRTPAAQYVAPRRGLAAPMFWPERDIREGNYLIVTTLIRRDLFLELGGFPPFALYEDWALFARCLEAGATVERVPGAVCRVHINPVSKHRHGTTRQDKQRAYHQVRRALWPELYEEAGSESHSDSAAAA